MFCTKNVYVQKHANIPPVCGRLIVQELLQPLTNFLLLRNVLSVIKRSVWEIVPELGRTTSLFCPDCNPHSDD